MLEKETARSAKAAPKAKAAAPKAKKATAAKPAAPEGQDDMEERIQRRAYELWESEGRPAGREHDHWLQAEREIARTRPQRAGVSR